MHNIFTYFLAGYLLLFSLKYSATESFARCTVFNNQNQPLAEILQDPLFQLLNTGPDCPKNVFELRSLLTTSGGQIKTGLVDNQGFHNPSSGSFSLFETVDGNLSSIGKTLSAGDFYFGHFTGISSTNPQKLTANQDPSPNNLMIELIAWDSLKGVYNFYELIGNGTSAQWFYRGDSLDILADTEMLHRQRKPGDPVFGPRLRCSGCHINGGPIMKELAQPHNDWWRKQRPLPLGGRTPDTNLAPLFNHLEDAGDFAQAVAAGMEKLQSSPSFLKARQNLSLQELLRPLFAAQEIAFESESLPHDAQNPVLTIPAGFFIDPRFGIKAGVVISALDYKNILALTKSSFPKINHSDADHAWLTPVKSASDVLAIDKLVEQGLIDRHFVMAVLAIDFTNPVFSPIRAGLLKLLPATLGSNWKTQFIDNLKNSSVAGAAELALNLTDPLRDTNFHQTRAQNFITNCRLKSNDPPTLAQWYQLLMQRRLEIAASEVSQNPRGQILEPDFRVIFPESAFAPAPHTFQMTESGNTALLSVLTVQTQVACENKLVP